MNTDQYMNEDHVLIAHNGEDFAIPLMVEKDHRVTTGQPFLEDIDEVSEEILILAAENVDEWEAENSYLKGDFVSWEGALIQCEIDHDANEELTPTNEPSNWTFYPNT